MFSLLLLLLLLGSPPHLIVICIAATARIPIHPSTSRRATYWAAAASTGGIYIYNNAANKTVPPNIVDSGTTDGVVAREGSNVSLSCRATGHPEPNITWKREDGSEFIYNGVAGQFDPRFFFIR